MAQRIGRQHGQDRERKARPHALNRRQQAEGIAFSGLEKSIKVDVIFANVGLDVEAHDAARPRSRRQGPRRAEHEIAHPADIENDTVGGNRLDSSSQLGDHGRASACAAMSAGKLR